MANNIEKLLSCIVGPAQGLEDALQQLRTERFVDTAVGSQLDLIGKIVGQPRDGLSDDDYRRYIRAKVAVNNSEGTCEDLLLVAFLTIYDVDADIVLTQEGTATARLRIDGIPVTDALGTILFKFIDTARAAGVRIVVEWAISAPANVFQFNDGPGFNQGALASGLG